MEKKREALRFIDLDEFFFSGSVGETKCRVVVCVIEVNPSKELSANGCGSLSADLPIWEIEGIIWVEMTADRYYFMQIVHVDALDLFELDCFWSVCV